MGPFEWVALVGAAAWVPQVIGWVTRLFVRPVLRVIPSRAPEIGYSSLGPVFNLSCAIAADRRDGIIERMTAQVTHERGQSTTFQWATLRETISQAQSSEGGFTELVKSQPAVALKVSTLVLTEKQIGMQERQFEEDARLLVNALIDQQSHLKKVHPESYQDLTLVSKEFSDLIDFARKRFAWQEGRHTVRLELKIAGVKRSTFQIFHFALTNNDVERLRENLSEIERYVRELIRVPEGKVNYRWNWAYPPFDEPLQLPASRPRKISA